jgi:hypothetical protein
LTRIPSGTGAGAKRVELVRRQVELGRDRERDALHAARVTGGVRILRVDRRVEALDRLERARFEPLVRLHQCARPVAELARLRPQRARGGADEERQGEPREQDAGDRGPDHVPPRGERLLDPVRVGVDLVGAEDGVAIGGEDRRVDLEQVVEAQALLDPVLLDRELVDVTGGDLLPERLGEVTIELEALADPALRAVRPREHAVGAPDLHGHERPIAPELAEQPPGHVPVDPEAVAVDELSPQNAVDVLRDTDPVVGDRLRRERACQDGAEDEAAERDDHRAREQEDAQERHGALRRSPQIRTGSEKQSLGPARGIGSNAAFLYPYS